MTQFYNALSAVFAGSAASLVTFVAQRKRWHRRRDSLEKRLKEVKSLADARTAKLLVLGRQARDEVRLQMRARADEVAVLRTEISRLGVQLSDTGNWGLSKPSIIINTLPKVGSSSIRRITQQAFPEALVAQTHSISLQGRQDLSLDLEACRHSGAYEAMLGQWHLGMRLQHHLKRLASTDPGHESLYHICGTREPIGWALSHVFQLAAMNAIPGMCLDCGEVRRIIMDWHSGRPLWCWTPWPDAWMRRELAGPLELDLLGVPFDTAIGYQIYNTARGRLLIYRIENFDRIPSALGELFSAPPSFFERLHEHGTRDKPVGRIYEDVASTIKFPRAFLEQVYAEPYAATFYTEAERAGYLCRWAE